MAPGSGQFAVKHPDDFVDNLDEMGKAMIKDPMFWVSLVVAPYLTANITWGFFDAGVGINGLSIGPNLLKAAGDTFRYLTGSGFSFGVPTVSVSTPFFSGQWSLFSSPMQYVQLASYQSSERSGGFFSVPDTDRYGNPVSTNGAYNEYVDSWFDAFGDGEAPMNLGFTDFDTSPWNDYGDLTPDDINILMAPPPGAPIGFDPYALPRGGATAFSRMAYASGQGPAFERLGAAATGIATLGRGAAEVGATVGSVFFEPLDWGMTAREIYNEPTSLWSYAGLVPFVPATVGKVAKLTQKELRAVEKIENILSKNLKPGRFGDVAGTTADMVGSPIWDARKGRYFDHVGDMNQMLRALRSNADKLRNVADPAAAATRQRAIDVAAELEDVFKGIGI